MEKINLTWPITLIKPMTRLLWFALLFFCVNAFAQAESINSKLAIVNGQIHTLEQTIDENRQQQLVLQQKLKNTEISLGKLSSELIHLTQSLIDEQTILATLKKTQLNTWATLQTQNDALKQQLRAAYQLGEMQHWKIMLNQEHLDSMSRHIIYYRYLNAARLKLILDIKQNLLILAQSIQAAKIHQAKLQRLVLQKQNQQHHQQRILKLRQQLIAEMRQQTQTKQEQIDLLLANQKALQQTISRLKTQNITIDGQAFSKLQGKLHWPVKGSVVMPYGSLLDVGNQRESGVLLKVPTGTPVKAVYSGKVIFADWLRGFGLLIIINHGDNYMTLYGRNQAIYAKVGHIVKTGDIIALTGNSGGYDKSSLYFEIRQNGSPINPAIWCR